MIFLLQDHTSIGLAAIPMQAAPPGTGHNQHLHSHTAPAGHACMWTIASSSQTGSIHHVFAMLPRLEAHAGQRFPEQTSLSCDQDAPNSAHLGPKLTLDTTSFTIWSWVTRHATCSVAQWMQLPGQSNIPQNDSLPHPVLHTSALKRQPQNRFSSSSSCPQVTWKCWRSTGLRSSRPPGCFRC